MADFGYLKGLDVNNDRTARFTLYEIVLAPNNEPPTLILKHAGETNKAFFNAQLKRATRNRRQLTAGAINAGTLAEAREEDKQLYPEYIIVGWENVVDGNGEPVPFSKDECRDFISKLPNWLFDNVRNFASDPSNFTETPDAESAAKNSQSG